MEPRAEGQGRGGAEHLIISEESWDTAAFTKCGSDPGRAGEDEDVGGVGVQAGRGRSLEMTPDLRPPGSAPRVVTLPKVFPPGALNSWQNLFIYCFFLFDEFPLLTSIINCTRNLCVQ